MLRLAVPEKIIVESYPKLEKGKAYIYAATHSFVAEIPTLLSVIDRSVYTLMGSTNQLECNPKVYANWVNGLIYVDRNDKKSRNESLLKMQRVLESGSSVLIFPEGGWNNTENLLVQKLFPGVYKLAQTTDVAVVPICCFHRYGSKTIYVNSMPPIDMKAYEKSEGMEILRDALATMMYKSIEKHSVFIKRASLKTDPRLSFMRERRKEYLKTKWTRDVWEEELTVYKDRRHPLPCDVRATFDHVCVNKCNAAVIAPILKKREDDVRYDFLWYMKRTWNK